MACLQRSYHPKPFRHSETVVIRKPQKAAYDIAKAYRPIALLNAIGNVLVKVVARRMLAPAKEHYLLPATQMGARPGRSTANCAGNAHTADPGGQGERSHIGVVHAQSRHLWSIRQRLPR